MLDVLAEIIGRKKERVAAAKERAPLEGVRRRENPHALRAALRAEGINVIAEFKRRSPSKGVIRADANLSRIESYLGNRNCGAPWTSVEEQQAENRAETTGKNTVRAYELLILQRAYAVRDTLKDVFSQGSVNV